MKRKISLLSLIFIAFWTSSLYGESLVLKDNEVLRYANFLYGKGEYYRSISEYKRLLFYFPQSSLAPQTEIQLGKAYMAGGNLDGAIEYWRQSLEKDTEGSPEYYGKSLLLGLAWLDLFPTKIYTLRKESIDKGMEYLERFQPLGAQAGAVSPFLEEWNDQSKLEFKSPLLAGSLSAILPGAGSAYTGRYKEGVYSLVLTALFAAATYDAIQKEEKGLAYVFGFFSVTFYGGSIYTAVNSAYKYNDLQHTEHLRNLRQKYGMWFVP